MSTDLKGMFTLFDRRAMIPKWSIAYHLIKQFGQDPLVYPLLFLIVLPCGTLYAGLTQGFGKTDFYLLEANSADEQPELVIRIMNGIVISALYDLASNSYQDRFQVRATNDLGGRAMSPIHVEGLKVAK